jgi:hypothetical protein
MRRRWRHIAAIALVSLCAVTGATPSAAALEASEAAIKAAFLYKFGFFIEWPESAFAASDSPINLCVVGADPFGTVLDETVKGKKIGNRPISLHRAGALSPDLQCHIVYLSEGAASQSLPALRKSDVLTVTDVSGGADHVGIINFVIKDKRVRFDIDDAAAASVGLTISSRLLSLALQVKPRH